jgi:phage terminase large subunit-like protein
VSSELDAFRRFCAALVLDNGKPMVLEPFQERLLGDYFEGTRETAVLVSKKNAKTTTLAALALFHLLSVPEAECVIAASSRDQAQILFDQAVGFVKRSPGLQKRVTVKRGYREIRAKDGGRIRVLAADADTADGVIPTLALVDELHRHKSAELYHVFRDGLGPRQGRMLTISTAGDDDASPLGELRSAAYTLPVRERDGAYRRCASADGAFVLHEWALEPGADVDDMELVKTANPASWHTLESLRERHDSPSTTSWLWKRFACGIWVRGGAEKWMEPATWDACAEERAIPDGADVVLGFDGSFNMDATAIVAVQVGEPPHLDVVKVWERTAEMPDDWTVPIADVEHEIRQACKRWRVLELVADPYRWQRSLEILRDEHVAGEVVEYPSRMIPATTRFAEAVANKALTHSGDPDLARHVDNAVLRVGSQGAQLEKISKKSARKIDLAVAAVMAYERAAVRRPGVPHVWSMDELLADDAAAVS